MDVLLGLIAIVIGLAVGFAGYRLFLYLLPIWGFVVGFWVGGAAVRALAGGNENFLATATGWIVGIIVGLVFAVLSYLYWYVSIALLGASVGASIGTAILEAIGVRAGTNTAAHLIVGLILAVIFAAAVIYLNVPKYLVIVYSAVAGAALAIAGLLLLLGRIEVVHLEPGAAVAAVGVSPLWWIGWIVLAAVGLGVQLQSTTDFKPDLRQWRESGTGMATA